MARPTSRPRSKISSTLIRLREHFGESQEKFADRLQVALATLGRWESSSPPTGRSLDRLAQIAVQSSREDLAKQFRAAFRRVALVDLRHILDLAVPTLRGLGKDPDADFDAIQADLIKGLEQARDLAIKLEQSFRSTPPSKGASKKHK
jgi:transcriptional regulator with XRE-family HTH domain